ncbi:DUF2321 domain-containing protein [Methanonatronarchaeum sp. AMET-Sl]|uniref:DUF2321 domain-containing protein n=1 Tax=Methanonatronarchaeum sp. AMET-Sl TaxID=3037654 RepID=UPI00244E0409|nr:DUF2321 domain-containing protein [Methanonatronarchaeum sp. AMET-Sl]WGI17953.1 DUF2321 domain-containing protein [Methanonatronarchaeum sp. AMET-Sl]
MGYYDVAQICLNGHVITERSKGFHQATQEFCSKCGEPTIENCPNCDTKIRGEYVVEGAVFFSEYSVPKFCHGCGEPYPWTKEKIQVAKKYAQMLENLDEEEKQTVEKNIDDIIKDSPRTKIASLQFKKNLDKAKGKAKKELKDIIVEIASETAVKLLKGE